jgi:diaminohydroxyphosphoribosylaminopyrimidine deaminase/5-amino-6-(5-phosphoribosylamino)uracil reductase
MPPDADSDPDVTFMRRAIRLATNGRGRAEPNPTVGCVIVSADGRVIGEGYHERYGRPHAEPNALAACTESPAGATAYVTLEPCCHTNKQTPPCAPRLIEAKLARVVIGCPDPNPAVNGKGAAMLREAGVRVDASALEPACRQLIAPFVARVLHGRPYVTLKWAQTADGRIAGPGGRRLQISNARSTRVIHHLRARCDAIMVGVNTVIADDPLLTPRDVPVDPERGILRVVLDRDLRIPRGCRLLSGGPIGSYVIVYTAAPDARLKRRVFEFVNADADVVPTPLNSANQLSLPFVLHDLVTTEHAGRPVTHLLVEPGPTLAAGFFDTGLCDRLWVVRSAAVSVGDPTAPAAASVPAHFVKSGELALDGDVLTEYLNPHGLAYFANEPSADLVLPE